MRWLRKNRKSSVGISQTQSTFTSRTTEMGALARGFTIFTCLTIVCSAFSSTPFLHPRSSCEDFARPKVRVINVYKYHTWRSGVCVLVYTECVILDLDHENNIPHALYEVHIKRLLRYRNCNQHGIHRNLIRRNTEINNARKP